MFVWARIPESFEMKSMEFSRFLLEKAKVAVSPGLGFGEYGDDFVRFSLIENEQRTNQAVRGIKKPSKSIYNDKFKNRFMRHWKCRISFY